MIHLRGDTMNVQYLAGAHEVHNTVLPPYDDLVCEFLDTLAGSLRRDSEAKKYPDVQTFAFWCRKANIQKLKKVYQQDEPYIRLGKGVIFHIAPSNVPINAGFTYVMGLLPAILMWFVCQVNDIRRFFVCVVYLRRFWKILSLRKFDS